MNTLTHTPSSGTRHNASAPSLMTLPIGEARTLRHRAGARLEVTSGRVWLTEPDDLDDYFVASGESLLLHHNGPVVVQSDGASAAVLRIVTTSSARRLPWSP
ncbi:DUF2917 domain-containing protein [Variovorax sp. ZT5R36]|uniref:DUF2917 domain-containing protein n=2 Tax=unclassified Variovorax TaxID=663243 RepID=UPI003F497959